MIALPLKTAVAQTNSCCGWLLAVLLAFPSALLAQSPDPAAAFARGRAAFERNDFESALAGFEAALAAGLNGPAIHFNIGVAAYRTRNFGRAKIAFAEVARTQSMAALAHYNLGLVAIAESDRRAARDHFNEAYSQTDDERLQSLASAQLGALTPRVARVTWDAYSAAGVGYDDNVTLSSGGTEVSIAKEGDTYADVLLAGSAYLGERWRLDGDLTFLNYGDLDRYDQWGLNAGARYRLRLGAWRTDVGGQLGVTYLDGNDFEQRGILILQTARSLNEPWYVRLRYRLAFVDAAEEFEGLDGTRQDVTARLGYQGLRWNALFGYRFDLTEYDSAAFSAQRHSIYVDVTRALTRRWSMRGMLNLRHSQYDDDRVGNEDRVDVLVAGQYRLSARWTLVLQYQLTDSDADIGALDYRRNRYFIGAEAAF